MRFPGTLLCVHFQRPLPIFGTLLSISNFTTPNRLAKWIEDMQPEMERFLDVVCHDDLSNPPFSDQLEAYQPLTVDRFAQV
jgi:hypothetical protein